MHLSDCILVALAGGLCDSGFFVNPGDCRHLAGVVLVVDHGEDFGDCYCLRSLAIVLIPAGESRRVTLVKSYEVPRGP